MMCCRYKKFVWTLVIIWGMNFAYAQGQEAACPDLVGLMIPQLVFHTQARDLPRVEVRKCGPGESLKIICWAKNAQAPDLIVDTTDFTIVQSVMLGLITVIETTGGPRNRLFVIDYDRGKPKLALKFVSKAQAELATRMGEIRIAIEESGTGQIKHFRFPTHEK
jgi:hypothetical protein